MASPFASPVAEATSKTIMAVTEAQKTGIEAGFELAGKVLEHQRVASLAMLNAFAASAPDARKS